MKSSYLQILPDCFFQISIVLMILIWNNYEVKAQLSIPNSSPQTINFDIMGTSATAALPTGFRVSQGTIYSGGTSVTTHAAGSTGTGVLNGSSAGGVYNFANGITGSSSERALGFLNSGGFTTPRSIMLELQNTSGAIITELDISFNYEKYRSGTRAWDWTFFTGTDGTAWVANVSGNESYAADANNTTISNPPTSVSKSFTITGLSIPNNGFYYLRWTLTGVGGSTNGQALGIDDFSITATTEENPPPPPCTLQIVSINESECLPTFNDTFPNGYFLYDVEVAYFGGIPTTGSLILSGGEGASVPVGSLSGGTYTFTDLRGPSGNMPFNVTALFSDNSGCLSMGVVNPPEGCTFSESDCQDLYISEYLEGESNNKCLEIYNPTGNSINLLAGEYKILVFYNGSAIPNDTIELNGVIGPYGTHVLCNTLSTGSLLLLADQTSSALQYNGDDALALVKGPSFDRLDIFGNIGDDPGTAWTVGGNTTLNSILRRKANVLGGVTTNPGGTGPTAFTTLSSEWDAFTDSDFSNLGTHESACTPPIPECPLVDLYVYPEEYNFEACGESFPEGVSCYTCNDNGTPDPSDDYFEYYVEVGYNDLPETGYLIISLNGSDIDSVDVGELLFPEGVEYLTFGPYSHTANGLNFIVSARFDEVILCSLSAEELAPGPCSFLPPCEELFFSEYIEGTGFSKCLEIFNPTDASVDLAANNYQIRMYFNGSGGPGFTINLTGVVPSKGTYVVCSSNAAIEFRNMADQLSGTSWFNGDDAVSLAKDGINIDIIGQIGIDPGTQWSGAGVSTLDQTIRRKPFITAGDPNGTDAFDPSIEWDGFPVNDISGLKFHRSDCNQFSDGLVITPIGGCDGEVAETEGGYDIASSCWGGMIGREATFLATDICGNFDISAKVTVEPFGFAGIMFRESLSLDTRMVYQFVRGNNIASWGVRANPALPLQIQIVPQINRQHLRMQRVGNLFRGYLSVNGIVWNQVHQSGLNIDVCGYVGFATHSGNDGVWVNSSYTNINTSFSNNHTRPQFVEDVTDQAFSSSDFKVYPNPANQYLDIQLSGSEWAEREISIIDFNGRLAFYQKSETSNVLKIDLQSAGLTDGVYIIQIKDAEGFYQTRFVKASN